MAKELKTDLTNEKIVHILRKFMIFKDLSPEAIKKILHMDGKAGEVYQSQIVKLCQYEAGEVVIHEGEFDCWSFWVVKGMFDVIQNQETIITFSYPGEIFGEMSVLDGIPRTASVVSVTPGVCLCLDMSVIENLADDSIRNTIKNGFYKVILERLSRTKNRMKAEKEALETKYAYLLKFEKKIRSRAEK